MENKSISVQKKSFQGIRFENPFTFKVGQVFTGFGIGCGVGIGVGRPLNVGSIPVLNQVMSATRGATDVFSGIGRQANVHLRKLGAKNVEAGIGCGVGFGHGFGVGLAVKPAFLNQLQNIVIQELSKLMLRFGMNPNLSAGLPSSSSSSTTIQNPMKNIMHSDRNVPVLPSEAASSDKTLNAGSTFKSLTSRTPDHFSRTEEVMNSFLQSTVLNENDDANEQVKRLRSENNILQMVFKQQQVIEELLQENKKFRKIFVEDLNIPATKLQSSNTGATVQSHCKDCFECRRRERKNRRS